MHVECHVCICLMLHDVHAFTVSVFQATIGIDFLSKTMYLEDRTVWNFSIISVG